MKVCKCKSGESVYELLDARGIFVANVCNKCEDEVKSHYRPEIFTDANYEASEPIDEE